MRKSMGCIKMNLLLAYLGNLNEDKSSLDTNRLNLKSVDGELRRVV